MSGLGHGPHTSPLLGHLRWFARLRWLAGATVLLGGLADRQFLQSYGSGLWIPALGLLILAYNVALGLLLRGRGFERRRLLAAAWIQILADLVCLAALAVLTGGPGSPVLGFFVFHMVIASLLLPRYIAHSCAAAAAVFLTAGLWLSGQWPYERHDALVVLGWVVTLPMTVHLANHITRGLRQQHRRLVRQNRRIRLMSRRLRRQQRALAQQEKMVALGQMAAGVAHEIANPLASMDGLLQLLERRPERLNVSSVATLREQVARIHQILRQMTAFAHPDQGDRQATSLDEIVESALQLIRFDPRLKPVRVERELAADAGRVMVQSQAMQQVVVNLVINALDAMAQTPQAVLRVKTCVEQGRAVLMVMDNGPGIAPEHLPRVFEPFFTTKPVGQGTGLGLSISYSLVKKQGGEIRVESAPGAGARFWVVLPLVPTVPTPAAAPATPAPTATLTPAAHPSQSGAPGAPGVPSAPGVSGQTGPGGAAAPGSPG